VLVASYDGGRFRPVVCASLFDVGQRAEQMEMQEAASTNAAINRQRRADYLFPVVYVTGVQLRVMELRPMSSSRPAPKQMQPVRPSVPNGRAFVRFPT
jgi:hypothetical protein